MESKQRTRRTVSILGLICLVWNMAAVPLFANEELNRYIAMLDAKDPETKIIAVRGIAGFRHNAGKAVRPMMKLLENDNMEVRLAALNAYAEIGIYAKQAIPAIEKQLSHTNPFVRYYAAVALSKTGSLDAAAKAKPILDLGSPEAVMATMLNPSSSPENSEEVGTPAQPTVSPIPASPTPPTHTAPIPPSIPIR